MPETVSDLKIFAVADERSTPVLRPVNPPTRLIVLLPQRTHPHRISMATLELQIDGMHCGACVRRVTQTLNTLPDTHAGQVQIGRATVSTAASPDTLLEALQTAGFPARVAASQP